ncbi:hypothetical protein SARC_11162 [Sphaeroforma arctica JP610]|uniref:Uncharacterized protein n=1 Tax=Sphaeroforma arctica JP610 TaxID=667725 RepID=A0A0L0FIM3_9EUKA|nr:hypothetical protein SARC_11162 [Sphaeroforma arctica JP610]KNC76331.1 hypothetical protein SARC_11162 [Sphaeroforma arctica JP610]|eukprot:XP_014150233.1 hypothetical protein SARC_11162 [Sphaeroforma arctica JP610]
MPAKKAIREMKARNPVDAGISALTLEAPVPQYALPHPYAPNPHATDVPPSLDTLSPQIQQSLLARDNALSDSIGQKGKRKLSVSDNSGDDEAEDSGDDDTIQQDQADANSDSSSESDSEDDLLARDVFGDLSDEDDDEEDA